MAAPLLVAKTQKTELLLLPALANRHGLIAGATGTGKSVTLQSLAQAFSSIGVPVFMADVKGDLSGLAKSGGDNAKVAARATSLKLELAYAACPVVFWDVFGKNGHPVRATVSDMGPLLLARMLGLNDTQEGVLNLVFRIANDGETATQPPVAESMPNRDPKKNDLTLVQKVTNVLGDFLKSPPVQNLLKSIATQVGRRIGQEITRGPLGSTSRLGGGVNPGEGLPSRTARRNSTGRR